MNDVEEKRCPTCHRPMMKWSTFFMNMLAIISFVAHMVEHLGK